MHKDKTNRKIEVLETPVSVVSVKDKDYISLTDMLKAKDSDFADGTINKRQHH